MMSGNETINLNKPRVLVLNAGYEPMHIVSIKRAVTLLMFEVAEVVEDSHEVLRSPSTIMPVPSVIRLRKYIRRPSLQMVPLTRRNILRRDFFTCQYCGSHGNLTIDHVEPRSKGGLHAWENVVTACLDCNQRKGDKSLKDSHMSLKTQPKRPRFSVIMLRYESPSPETWQKYMY